MQKRSFLLSKVSLALLGCLSVMSAQALAQDNSSVNVLKLLERSSMTPATMCFVLDSRQGIINDTQNLMDFVKVAPMPPQGITSSIENNTLCITGLAPGQKYTLNLKQGLKLTSGNTLSADVNVPFAISDAQSQIKLPYNMILPKNNQNTSFTIETINQPAFKLDIYRLSTRSLNDLNLYSLLNNNVSNYSLVNLINENARLIYSKTFDLSSGKAVEIPNPYTDDDKLQEAILASKNERVTFNSQRTFGLNSNGSLATIQHNSDNAKTNAAKANTIVNAGTNGSSASMSGNAGDAANGTTLLSANASTNEANNSNATKGANTAVYGAIYGSSTNANSLVNAKNNAKDNANSNSNGNSNANANASAHNASNSVASAQSSSAYNLSALPQNDKISLFKPLPVELRNQPIKTEIQLSDFVSKDDDGMYLVLATDPRIDTNDASNLYSYNIGSLPISAKLLMFTDLGLTTYQSSDEILANVRSFTGASNMSGVQIDLIAANNEVLASGFTDDKGTVRFGKEVISGEKALRPIALVARTSKDDVYSLDLRSTPLYIEANQGKISSVDDFETFAYTDRGIYRPGEEVHYTALVRNAQLQALDAPLTLTIFNHQGHEIERILLTDSKSGGYEYDFKIAQGSGLGNYTAALSLGKKRIATTNFAVSSMVPLQINSEILNKDPMIMADTPFVIKSRTQFNYGSNAGNLNGQFTLTRYPDLKPIVTSNTALADSLKGFHFGVDEREQSKLTKTDQFYSTTDVEGVLQQQVEFKTEDYPQRVTVTSQVFDTNGQPSTVSKNFRLAYNRPLLGIKQLPEQNDKIGFAVCSYLQDGSTFPQDVKYYLYKEFNDYNFILEDGTWKYVTFKSKKLIDQGQIKVDNQNLNQALITADVDNGNYVIELKSDKSTTTFAFNHGFSSSFEATTPDTLDVFADKELYEVGDDAILSFESPFNGFANLVVGRQGIDSFNTYKVKRGHNEIKVPLSNALFPQGHALLSLYAPMTSQNPTVIRVVGMVDLNMNLASHKLNVETQVPNQIKPESTLTVKLQATPSDPKSQLKEPYAKLTLVDNGILQLTNFKAPDPNDILNQDRIFNVKVFDAYGYIMQDPKQQGQGYGGTAEKLFGLAQSDSVTTLFDSPIKSTALASKIVPLDDQGQATVDFEIPQFSGSLKVMAVAWDQDKTGADQQDVVVHDNAVASLGLPRYLNEQDVAQVRLNLHNLKSTDPNFKIDLSCSGALQCSQQSVLNLKAGARNDVFFKVKGLEQGTGVLSLKVMNKDFNYEQDYQLSITSPQLPMLNTKSYYLEPKGKVSVDLKQDFTNIQGVMISPSVLPNVNPAVMVRQIDTDSYGLQDQIASLESKLLYGQLLLSELDPETAGNNPSSVQARTDHANQVQLPLSFTEAKYRSQAELNDAIQELVDRISAQLNYNNTDSNDFNLVYATDVLMQAHAQGFVINSDLIERQLAALRKLSPHFHLYGMGAYANAVLSKIEGINLANVRVAIDEGKLTQPLQLAYLAQTLHQIGDHNRGAEALDKAITNLLAWQQLEQKRTQKIDQKTRDEINGEINNFKVTATNIIHDAYVVLDTCIKLGQEQKALDLLSKLTCINQPMYFVSDATLAAMLRTNYDLGADSNALAQNAGNAANTGNVGNVGKAGNLTTTPANATNVANANGINQAKTLATAQAQASGANTQSNAANPSSTNASSATANANAASASTTNPAANSNNANSSSNANSSNAKSTTNNGSNAQNAALAASQATSTTINPDASDNGVNTVANDKEGSNSTASSATANSANTTADNTLAQQAVPPVIPVQPVTIDASQREEIILSAEQSKLPITLLNSSDKPMYKTLTVLGSMRHDKSITQGVGIRVNYFNKSKQLKPDEYTFRLNEEVLMEVVIHQSQDYNSDSIVKIKLPAGFEYVRTATMDEPNFGHLLKSSQYQYKYAKVEAGDDIAIAKYPSYESDSRALLLVLRAAIPGTYSQGEALVQMTQSPQIFGTYQGAEKLHIKADK